MNELVAIIRAVVLATAAVIVFGGGICAVLLGIREGKFWFLLGGLAVVGTLVAALTSRLGRPYAPPPKDPPPPAA